MKSHLLTDSYLLQLVQNKIEKIVECMSDCRETRIGLMSGKAGEALFWAYYTLYSGSNKYGDKVVTLITDVFDQIKKDETYFSFSIGLAGVGWTIGHLAQQGFIEADTDYLLGDLDVYLYSHMLAAIKRSNYDYLHGAVGIGIYYLSRLSNPKTKKYLRDLVDELERQSIKFDSGIAWESELTVGNDLRGFNLSLSHGIASIISFLGRVYHANIHRKKVLELINGAVNYLLQNKYKTESQKYRFPGWICEKDTSIQGRLAWCYNDLGISVALWHAGQIFNNETWKQEAIKTIMLTTKITDLKEAGVMDAGFCHGASGIAHIYYRMFQNTKIDILKKSAEYWMEQTVKMAIFDDGLAGYKTYRLPRYGGWQNHYGLLEGIAGIGLVMMSAVSDTIPEWDSALLLS